LIEFVVRVRDGPGEVSWDGDLHGREPSRAVVMTGKDVHWLPRHTGPRHRTKLTQPAPPAAVFRLPILPPVERSQQQTGNRCTGHAASGPIPTSLAIRSPWSCPA